MNADFFDGDDCLMVCPDSYDPKSPDSVTSSYAVISPQSPQLIPFPKSNSIQDSEPDVSNGYGIESVSSSPNSTHASDDGAAFDYRTQDTMGDTYRPQVSLDVAFSNFAGGQVPEEPRGIPGRESFLNSGYNIHNYHPSNGQLVFPNYPAPETYNAFQYSSSSTVRFSQPMSTAQETTSSGPWNSHNQLRSPGNNRPSNMLFFPQQYINYWHDSEPVLAMMNPGAVNHVHSHFLHSNSGNSQTPFTNHTHFHGNYNTGLQMPHRFNYSQSRQESADFEQVNNNSYETSSGQPATREGDVIKKEAHSPPHYAQDNPFLGHNAIGAKNFEFVNDDPRATNSSQQGPSEKITFAESLSKFDFPVKKAAALASHKAGKLALQKHTGRQVGSHLTPEIKQHASEMRKTDACWRCRIQRDKCSQGKTCDRCIKARQSPDSGLGCCRAKIISFAEVFVPSLMVRVHNEEALKLMVDRHIERWDSREFDLYLTCGKDLPTMKLQVYEFKVKTPELLRQYQFINDPKTGSVQRLDKMSPPVGIILEEQKDGIDRCKRYVESIVNNPIWMQAFARCYFEDEGNDFMSDIFQLLFKFEPSTDDERKVQHEAYQLIVTTYIMTHTLTIPDDEIRGLSELRDYREGKYPTDCSPRLTNKQLKHFFAQLHRRQMRSLLNSLQQILKSSKWTERWATAFIAMVSLGIALEDIQFTTHLTMDTLVRMGRRTPTDAEQQACMACKEIDFDFNIVREIFKTKYTRMYNPLRDPQSTWENKISCKRTVQFVNDAQALFKEHVGIMYKRSQIEIAGANKSKYCGRLVSKFVHMLYMPWDM